MLAAVVPVKNEAKKVARVIKTLLEINIDLIIPVINGCKDDSYEVVKKLSHPSIHILYFEDALGIDVPRAVGSAQAYKMGAKVILFVDGDMDGNIGDVLKMLLATIARKNACFALTNCYPPEMQASMSSLARYLLKVRFLLNSTIGLEKKIGVASPSHGPHAISSNFLEQIPVRELAIPPVCLAIAVKKGLSVVIGADIPHFKLGSPQKDPVHCHRLAETIIGDCLEAIQVYSGQPRNRTRNGITFIGYHLERRFDLLEKFLNKLRIFN